jgi:hypothetical protein
MSPLPFHSFRRRHILLLEVLIAFALVALCVLPLIFPHVFILRSEKKFNATVELDHTVNVLYADILQKLYQNEIAWSDIERGTELPIDAYLLQAIGYKKELPFTGTYQFVHLKHRPRTPGDITAYLFSLQFSFTPKPQLFLEKNVEGNQEKIVYKYQVAIERNTQ